MAVELRLDPATKQGAIQRVAERLGMRPETLAGGSGRPRSTTASVRGTATAEAERIAKLEQEVRELLRANHILNTSA
jgi:transposase